MVWVEFVKMPVDDSEELLAYFCFNRAAERRIQIYTSSLNFDCTDEVIARLNHVYDVY